MTQIANGREQLDTAAPAEAAEEDTQAPQKFLRRNRTPIVVGSISLIASFAAGFFVTGGSSAEQIGSGAQAVAPAAPGGASSSKPGGQTAPAGPHFYPECTDLSISRESDLSNGTAQYRVAPVLGIIGGVAPNPNEVFTVIIDDVSGRHYLQKGANGVEIEGSGVPGYPGLPRTMILDTYGTNLDPSNDPVVANGSFSDIKAEYGPGFISCPVKNYPQ